jgi:endonuclease YncB( thermonuclease family)
MGFYVIKGSFHVVNYSPDGDSIRFRADNPANWQLLKGATVVVNGRGHAQLRLEAIDTLETHYKNTRQPLKLARNALEFLLERLNITDVVWNDQRTKVVSANDGTRGYIISREVERNHRPISFAFAGEAQEADGANIEFYADRLAESVNYQSIATGMAYPTYYQGLFPDLRLALSQAVGNARTAQNGIWAEDKTNTGFSVPNLNAIRDDHVILPKLFRRLVEHLEGGGTVANFLAYLEALDEEMTIISNTHFTHFDTVVEVNGDVVRMTEPPENLIFGE